MEIRKLTVGPDYKQGMNFIVGQLVVGGSNTIHCIKKSTNGDVHIYIINDKNEVVLYKEFSSSMPMSFEFNIDL